MKTRKITLTSVLCAISLVIFVIAAQIPPLIPVAGVKLGLSNVVVLFTKVLLGTRCALLVLLTKVFLGNLFTGTIVSFFYSLVGGIVCFLAECIALKFLSRQQIWAVSIIGGAFHNIGQVLTACILIGNSKIIWYLALLVPVGMVTGAFVGVCTLYTLKALDKLRRGVMR